MRIKLTISKIISIFVNFLLVFYSIAPAVYAQEATPTPSPTPIVQETATAEPTVTPSPTPTSSPEVSPAPTITPAPAPPVTPAPSETPAPTQQPTATPSLAPSPSPIPQVSPIPPPAGGKLTAVILPDTSATSVTSLDLDPVEVTASASLITDKADYAPTDTVVISGTGLKPNTTYILVISSTDNPPVNFQTNVTADNNGGFVYAYQLDGTYRPNYKVELKDSSGNIVATTTFTDANPSASLDQCANDPAPSPSTNGCDTNANQWVNGNIGESKAVYLEGDSIPYRMLFDNLGLASHTVTIEWDTTKSGKHAIDYLTTFNRTVVTANPCLGVSGCSSSTAFAIPADPQVTGAGVTPVAGNFTLFGGTITGVSAYSYADGAGFTGDKSARITITFTASVANPVLAWGGHIATRVDWGSGNSAVNIPGSPYHTRLIDLDGSGGNQDRSLSAEAVIFPGSITIIKDAVPDNSQDFSYTTTGGLSPDSFSLDDDAEGTLPNTRLYSSLLVTANNGNDYTITEGSVLGWTLSFNSPVCTITSPNGGSQSGDIGTRTVSINLREGENVSCTFINTQQKAHLTLVKTITNDNGGTAAVTDWTLSAAGPTNISGVSGNAAVTNAAVNAGAYILSESGGPAGYTGGTYSCVVNGGGAVVSNSITLAPNDNATCTINNDDNVPALHLRKTITTDNGGTAAITDWTLTATGAGILPTNLSGTTPVDSGSNFKADTYALAEVNGPSDYTAGTWGCVGGTMGDTTHVTVALGQSATCTINNDDNAAHLIIIKQVTNNNGGTKTAGDFSGTITGVTVSGGQSWTGTVFPGVDKTLTSVGSYGVSETADPDYDTTYSTDCTGTIALGQTRTCTVTNNDKAAHLIVIKHVVNDNGGTAVASDFTTTISGVTTATPTAAGVESPGVNNTLITVGSYSVDEGTHTGYTRTLSADCSGTIALGQTRTCTVTNDDIAPSLTLLKTVANDNGGTAVGTDWTLTATGAAILPTNLSGTTPVSSGTGFKADTYSLGENSGPSGYTPSLYSCVKNEGVAVPGNSVTLGIGDSATCTINNDDIAPTLTIIKQIIPDTDGGLFNLQIDATTKKTNASDGDSTGAVEASAGVHTVGEVAGTGTNLSNYTAEISGDCASDGTITLALAENKTCTITNTRKGSITVVKDARPNDCQDFVFTMTGQSGFALDDDQGVVDCLDTNQPQSKIFNNLTANNSFTITETIPNSFWALGSIACVYTGTSDTYSNTSSTTNGVVVTVDPGANITCTFVNNKLGPTRTLGFWKTHTTYTTTIFSLLFGSVTLGSGTSQDPVNSTSKLFGAWYSSISMKSTGKGKNAQRTPLDQARIQLAWQWLATTLNCEAFGCDSTIQNLLLNASIAYAGTNISSILSYAALLDAYNNSGDTIIISPAPGSATPKASQGLADKAFWDSP